MGLHPDVQKEKEASFLWWKEAGSAIKTQGSTVTKVRENPDFAVAVGAMQYTSGKHDLDFYVNRQSEGYIYVGVAVPDIALDQTFCRRDARDKAWYYFGCGYTNALRNGWDDVVSKEVGGVEMKIPKMHSCDRIRAHLDMDLGELKFSIFRLDDGGWKLMPGKITGISGPVVAACCLQERSSVSLGDASRVNRAQVPGIGDVELPTKRVDKYAHIQSRVLADIRINPPPLLKAMTEPDMLLNTSVERAPSSSSSRIFSRAKSERYLNESIVLAPPSLLGPHSPTCESEASLFEPRTRPITDRQCQLNLRHNHFSDFDLTIGRGYLSPRISSSTPRLSPARRIPSDPDPRSPPHPPSSAPGARLAGSPASSSADPSSPARSGSTLHGRLKDAARLQHLRSDNRTHVSMRMMTGMHREAAPVGIVERKDGGFLLVPRQLQAEGGVRRGAGGGIRQLSPGGRVTQSARHPPPFASSPSRARDPIGVFAATKEALRASLPTSLPRGWE